MTSTKTRLIFDHLPKTAGTSIVAAFSSAFGESADLAGVSNMHFQTVRSAGSRRLLAGHLWFAPGETLADGWYYCTLLRDPIDRFLSQYWFYRAFARQLPRDPDGGILSPDLQVRAAGTLELEEFLEQDDPRIKRSFTNVQAVHFAQRVCNDPQILAGKAMLDAAIEALEEYDLVGAFEDLQGFVDAACRDLGLESVELPRLNVTPERRRPVDTPKHLLRQLRLANEVDLDLYDWARKRFFEKKYAPAMARERTASSTHRVPHASRVVAPQTLEFGTRELEILSVRCAGEQSGTSAILSGELLHVALECEAKIPIDDYTIGIAVRDGRGQLIYGVNSRLLGLRLSIAHREVFRKDLVLQVRLFVGEYWVSVALHKGETHVDGCYHWVENAASFAVVGQGGTWFEGLVDLGLELRTDR